MSGRTIRWAVAGAAVAAALSVGSGVAWAAPEGRIQEVESVAGAVNYVLSADGLAEGQSIDPASVRTTLGGIEAPTTATPVTAQAGPVVARTTMIVLDSSGSMAEFGKLASAQEAAKQYLATLPADVKAGLVAFADEAELRVAPTEDRAAITSAIDALTAEGSTALNDAVLLTVDELGTEGTRNAVLLSDGEDEGSEASAKSARKALKASGVVLDAVSLGTGKQTAELAAFAKAGNGNVVTATDAEGLTAAFEEAARTVVTQLAVTATVPEDVKVGTSELVASALVGEAPITDTAVAVIEVATTESTATSTAGPISVASSDLGLVDRPFFLFAIIGAIFLALTAITSLAVGAIDSKNRQEGRVSRRLQEVTLAGAPPSGPSGEPTTVLGEGATVRTLVSFADRVAQSRDTSAIARKLEEANVSLRPAEWIIVHGLIVVLAGLLTTLLTNFNTWLTVLAIALGAILPWVYLSVRANRRRAGFYTALPDAMQMLAGSLSAGYSLPQALDNVAHESGGPLGQELNRALLESRLGLPIEVSLEAVAQRMQSMDFHWVVMAIRINRQVGGNLSEVLNNVARTLRERERLRRQVKTLSAEGVLSGWILGLLPFVVVAGILAFNPEYIIPMFTTPLGWLLLAVGAVLYLIGIIWMRNLIKMEV
jgi:tight adherence protein B